MKKILILSSVFFTLTSICQLATAQGSWTQKTNLPDTVRQGATGFVINGKAYIIGGWNFSVFFQDFWQYNPANDTWTKLPNFPGTPRQTMSAFSIGGKGYVGLGYNGSSYFNDWWEYDTLSNAWTQKKNFGGVARAGAVSFSINGKGYITTGTSQSTTYLQDVWEYNPSLDTWTQKNNFGGTARRYATGFVIGNVAYVGTGQGSSGHGPTFYKYYSTSDTWVQIASYPFGRSGCASFSVGNIGYTCVGYNGSSYQSSCSAYDTLSNTWTTIANYSPGNRAYAVGISIADSGYIGLGYSSTGLKNDWWQFTPPIPPPPVASFIVSNDTICVNSCVNFKDQSTNSPTKWSWTFQGGNPASSTLQNPPNVCFNTAGKHITTLIATNAGGSDTAVLYLTIKNSTSSTQFVTACNSYLWRGNTYIASGSYYDTISNAAGCDSTMVLNLTIHSSTSSLQTVTACDSYVWSGNTYYASGTYYDTISNSSGCDSTMVLNLTINNSTSSLQTVTTCDNYEWNGNTYTVSGTYYDTISNTTGCDSTMVLNLTINNSTSSSQTVTACESYVWSGNIYNASGTYYDTISNTAGCDSTMVLHLTINNSTSSSLSVSICDSYEWNGNTYTVSGTYYDTISNTAGCDSTMVLNLTISIVDTSVTVAGGSFAANAIGAIYKWLDCDDNYAVISGETNQIFTPTVAGNYAVAITQSGCTDTSSCYNVTIIGMFEVAQNVKFVIYPNPFSSQSILQTENVLHNATLTVFNVFGQTVEQIKNIKGKTVTLQRNDLPAGLYVIQLTEDNKPIATKKITIAD